MPNRTHYVAIRLNDDEMAALNEACKQEQRARADLLRIWIMSYPDLFLPSRSDDRTMSGSDHEEAAASSELATA